MAATTYSTTSEIFVCASCLAPVVLQLINADDLAYCCTNRRCQRAVHVDCPEGLALAEDAALIRTTMGIVESSQRRTATIEAMRIHAVAA